MSGISNLDKVPVKIVEKYKIPPPLYQLPQSVRNKLVGESKFCNDCNYDSQLDHHVLASLTEWRRLRQEAKYLRQERIKNREQLFQQKAEERQKQILEAISYPSTDDLSSSSESEKNDDDGDTNKLRHITNDSNSFYNILQPTVLSAKGSDVQLNNPMNAYSQKSIECCGNRKIENQFDYQDFEADTSSPFDNIELKTINDLDILAQVLHNTQITAITETVTSGAITTPPPPSPSSSSPLPSIQTKPTSSINVTNEIMNSNEDPIGDSCDINIPNELNKAFNASSEKSNNIVSMLESITFNNDENITQQKCESVNKTIVHHPSLKCDLNTNKSISVPNIVKELSDNLQIAALKRTKLKKINMMANNNDFNLRDDNNCEYFNQLDDVGKELVKNISDMGFPRERVSRIALLLGFDDKKIIEHLIPCTELADIGFNETDISDALLRYNNNKEKALEDLIS